MVRSVNARAARTAAATGTSRLLTRPMLLLLVASVGGMGGFYLLLSVLPLYAAVGRGEDRVDTGEFVEIPPGAAQVGHLPPQPGFGRRQAGRGDLRIERTPPQGRVVPSSFGACL
ncbi:hypothetical protein SCYAM73S_05749 [Streptomyces cyaneofuscatus]